jgi:hypothetical protein
MIKVPNPFRWLGDDGQWRLFLLVSILSIAVMVALDDQGSQLKTEASPWGIVSLEFAGSGEAATRMLAEWGERGRLIAGINLGLDFLFILVYAVALSLGSAIAARSHGRFSTSRERIGYLIAWGALLAGLFDVVENVALIEVLTGTDGDWWPGVARACARLKFAIVGVALAHIISTPLVTRWKMLLAGTR